MTSELEACLNKAIIKYDVREMLTRYGIEEDTAITLNMSFGDHSEAAAICPIPSATEKKKNSSKTISVKEFKIALTEKFMDPAIVDTELGEFMPDDENTLTLTFNDRNNNSIEDLVTVMACRPGSCGRPWCGTFLVS